MRNTPHSPAARLGRRGLLAVSVLALAAATGCSSDDDVQLTGSFADSPVTGLDVAGQATKPHKTDANGQFTYLASEVLSFSIGNLVLGSATGASTLTTLGITSGATAASDRRVTNKLVLLQTLDADGDLNNGIQITDAIRGLVSSNAASINFDQTTAAFATSLAPLMTALNAANVFTDLDPRARTVRSSTAALEHFARATSPRQVVSTTGGQLSGFEANASTWQYLGIPYAKPPVGELRWRPPQAPAAWTGVRHAVAWSDQAAQNPTYQALNEGGMSEDSLYLNVTAPKNASKLPVMVWFHGGAFTILSNNSRQYNNPTGVTTKGVVLVTVNHRLGPFGYLAHPLLTAEAEYKGSGNYGQMDLVMALTWVKNNIANFGGDPANVTIFGQSGGGGKTYSLMNSPQAKGLFHKAINQSGASALLANSTPASSLASNEAIGSAMFKRLGVTTLAQARALPWTQIVQSDIDAGIPREIYRPAVDNYHLPKTYYQNVQDGMPSDVPFMVGATSGDYASLRGDLPVFMSQRSALYKSPQYVYRFSRVPDGWAAMGLASGHGGEVPYLFNYPAGMASNYTLGLVLTNAGAKPPIADLNGNGVTGTAGDIADITTSMGWGTADTAMVDTVLTMWTNFAKTGNPSLAGLAWPAYTPANDTYMELGPVTPVVKTGMSTAYK
ncbi:MAG: carboxylesterase family protein [Burkholderiales bacterium]|nr:carboxylesterase family protein [Burkholderiales bacterium]